ncbi:physarolisin II [Candidatus Koribacter versatilis Ellin345]|uniref:Physarolisin II n=1 Tax=Koribacter versatilis (strain Ellin345) TaxID=204669 RepID=Q1ILV8_KORVE|nr:S53 family peptidase [Candidatus Koribacter versatilis]ABF42142.1 physarolisin II [Candidatus Koribacter versatilis Ellin345]
MKIPPRFLPCLLLATATVASLPAQTATKTVLPNNVPKFTASSVDLGPADPTQQITVTMTLASKNASGLQQFVSDIRTPGTGSYHEFLTPALFATKYGAADATLTAVKTFAAANGLTITHTAPNKLVMSLRGTVAAVENAFSVPIHNYKKNGETLRVNVTNPQISTSLVGKVTGVHIADFNFKSHAVMPLDPNGKTQKPVPLSISPHGLFFASGCFRNPQTITASGGGATATYAGNRYGSDITSGPPNLPPCGYDVADVYAGYNLWPMYNAGLDGTGETIVIIDAFGSPTIQADANTFSAINGLPALNSTNFQVVGANAGGNASWAGETTLDVEWAHAIAPNAKIVLEVAPTNSFVDLFYAEVDAIANHRGIVISNSWGGFETFTDSSLRGAFDFIMMEAISVGIDVNFSTGDYGDNVSVLGYADVQYPGSSPFATAVGGTSLALTNTKTKTMKFQTGWGNNITRLVDGTTGAPDDPPLMEGFIFGAGGGNSNVYTKPSWQVGTNQPRRALPDIAWLADPYTGVEIIQTISGSQYIEVIGGTSLAAPMFSGIWAIANQKANTTIGLGDAASQLYSMPSGSIKDVVPFNTANNVRGVLTDAYGTYEESSTTLAAPLAYTRGFYSALYQGASSHSWYDLTFGTDSTLFTKQGWDNVTGWGTPNGLNFVTAIANKK